MSPLNFYKSPDGSIIMTTKADYYLAACGCGWIGSSEHCNSGVVFSVDDEECLCPNCGAECSDHEHSVLSSWEECEGTVKP